MAENGGAWGEVLLSIEAVGDTTCLPQMAKPVASPPGGQWMDPTLSHIEYQSWKLLIPGLLLKAHSSFS